MTPLLLSAVLTLILVSQNSAFHPSTAQAKRSLAFRTPLCSPSQYLHRYQSVPSLFAVEENSSASASASKKTGNEPPLDEEGGTIDATVTLALPASENDQASLQQMTNETSTTIATATTTFMITNEMKRILIEELGYKRQEVNQIRIEIVDQIISKRIVCPLDGMPSTWYREDDDESAEPSSQDRMLQKLENESKYPLKAPLLGISLVLGGKGLTDALVTVIKVNMGFQGVSLMETFMGVPVLAIDFACVVLGVALGTWTWNNMKD
uniref:Uncharacterized protein n=1 Tax=Eucampia antarctica TaxID=49252 RepID=A0A6U0Q9U7_9STRA|mmetsp:Transcript_15479/g.14896  ORF Transcript_15479/g.14896 Transcript_15479/m.14896 type:complete len:266 (+) Transcript_15479:93-890(+)